MNIYKITNRITGESYIGKTSKSIEERLRVHFYTSNQDSQTHLHRAIRKYGIDHFTTDLLESQIPVENIDDREIFWIDKLQPEYNMTKGGEGRDTSSSPNFKRSMKEYHANKSREEYATFGMLGKTQSDQTKQKISESNSKSCVVMGIKFDSQVDAKEYLRKNNIKASIYRRFKDPRYPDWYRLD